MNILVLNGSPKGERSNTFKVTTAFLGGLSEKQRNQEDCIDISKADINHCLGCYACWTKTPGQCVQKDDMEKLIQKYIEADLVIWSFPLYYFGMPSKIKAFLDRLLPINLPFMDIDADGTSGHAPRYNLSHQRHVLISTCGFHSIKGNYDGLFEQFEILFGSKITKIICPEGELLRVPALSLRIDEYLDTVKIAGKEYAFQGFFSQETQSELEKLLYPPEVFVEMANADWEIEKINDTSTLGSEKDKSYPFLRQMAALYNSNMYTKDIVLEMYFTDLNKTYQLLLGKEKCIVKTDNFTPYTTRIETSFDTWNQISEGKISGSEAMMKKMYRALGDFDTLIKMDDFFSPPKADKPSPIMLKSSNMLLLLLPFLALWIVGPFDYLLGGMAGILASGVVTILHCWWKPTVYERIGAFAVTLVGLTMIITGGDLWQLSLPSFVCGILWLTSLFLHIPITAYYSSKDYGGESAYAIPLFIKTNRILTGVWSTAYLLWGTAELMAIGTANTLVLEISIWIFTGLLGIFTAWFAKWYPLKVAEG